jgi:hypothetical protein
VAARAGGAACLLRPQHHLRAAKNRNRLARMRDRCVPHLRGATKVRRFGRHFNRAVQRGAKMIALEFQRRESAGALRQTRHAAIAAGRIRQRHNRARMQKAVRRKMPGRHRHRKPRFALCDVMDFNAQMPRQMRRTGGLPLRGSDV